MNATYTGQSDTMSCVGYRGTEKGSQSESSGNETTNLPPYGDVSSTSMRGVMRTICLAVMSVNDDMRTTTNRRTLLTSLAVMMACDPASMIHHLLSFCNTRHSQRMSQGVEDI